VAALQSVLLFVIYRKEEIEILTLSFASDGAMAGGWLLSINMEERRVGGWPLSNSRCEETAACSWSKVNLCWALGIKTAQKSTVLSLSQLKNKEVCTYCDIQC
jgi:hypothetical protein